MAGQDSGEGAQEGLCNAICSKNIGVADGSNNSDRRSTTMPNVQKIHPKAEPTIGGRKARHTDCIENKIQDAVASGMP